MQDGNRNNHSRLDRLERIVEVLANVQADMQEEHKFLLKAQVVLTDRVDQLARITDQLAQHMQQSHDQLSAQIQHLAEKIDILVQTVDDIIRGKAQ